ncbi:MAG TPA: VOC family protein [Vicinamibacterales bacterium]|nr:VOC family protein [Vicinamibacterales bacterium]
MSTDTQLGRPLWYELMTTDTTAAEAFYRNVIGWTSSPFGEGPTPYTLFNRNGNVPVAGLMARPDDLQAPPFWAMYVAVPTIEEGAARVKELGGSECSPIIDVPGVGRMQMVADPQGASFYIFEPSSQNATPEGVPEVGDVSWHELMTTDLEGAKRFYGDLFNWEPGHAMDMGEMGTYQMFNRPHGTIGGMMPKPKEMAQVPSNWQFYFRVPDLAAAIERVKANGGQILNGPMEVPGGDTIVNAMDPQGATFSLHARKAQ